MTLKARGSLAYVYMEVSGVLTALNASLALSILFKLHIFIYTLVSCDEEGLQQVRLGECQDMFATVDVLTGHLCNVLYNL